MKPKNIKDLQEKYDLELPKIIKNIKKNKHRLVLLQFPDGLKPYASVVVDYLREKINNKNNKNKTEFLIWFGSCYGACDIPILSKELQKNIDLIIQFGHNAKMPDY